MGITLDELAILQGNLDRSRDAATLETANRRLSTANPKPPAKPAGLPTEAEEMEALCLS